MKNWSFFLAGFDSRSGRAALICLCVLVLFSMIHTVVELEEEQQAEIAAISESCRQVGGVPKVAPPAFFMHGNASPLVLCEKE